MDKIKQYKKELDNFNCWFVNFGKKRLVVNNEVIIIRYIKCNYSTYKKKYYKIYPEILIGNSKSVYSPNFEYDFMPSVECADDESLYLNLNDKDVIDVIIGCGFKKVIESNEMNNPKPSTKKTYLMVDNKGYTKIGKAETPRLREYTLQSQNPSIKLKAVCNSDIESILHNEYKKYKVRGEWFDLNRTQINCIINEFNFVKI